MTAKPLSNDLNPGSKLSGTPHGVTKLQYVHVVIIILVLTSMGKPKHNSGLIQWRGCLNENVTIHNADSHAHT